MSERARKVLEMPPPRGAVRGLLRGPRARVGKGLGSRAPDAGSTCNTRLKAPFSRDAQGLARLSHACPSVGAGHGCLVFPGPN